MTAFVYAAGLGHQEVVEVLIEHGASLAAPDTSGPSLLDYAAHSGSAETVTLLLQAWPDSTDPAILRALHFGAAAGQQDVVETFLDWGVAIDGQGNRGLTALMMAAAWGESAIVDFLLERGANPLVEDNEGIGIRPERGARHARRYPLRCGGRVGAGGATDAGELRAGRQ
jgi:ankyrin repeat protein